MCGTTMQLLFPRLFDLFQGGGGDCNFMVKCLLEPYPLMFNHAWCFPN